MPEKATTNESNHVTLILRELSDDEKMKYITEMREKALHDEATAINAAEKRGEKRGMEKARAEGLAEGRKAREAEIAEKIKVALGFGDLSENSEYDEAKNAQAENEGKIAELENNIRYAKIIDESEIDTKTVQVGNIVKVYDEEFDEEITYTIVGSTEVDLAQNKISNESPVGAALLGKKKNQEVEVKTPAGTAKYKILSITK